MKRRSSGSFHAVLLAGGGGTRFWPLSRARRPKQFLPLAGEAPLLVQSFERLRALVPTTHLWVVAPRDLVRPIRKLLPDLRPDRIVVEPSPKDTAPAATLATLRVAAGDPSAVLGFFPADHVVRKPAAFRKSVALAVRAASADAVLVCLGVVPDRAATGFGYLRCANRPRGNGPVVVDRFVEKPDLAAARRFVRSGRYLWNAGMFVWRASTFVAEMQRAAQGVLRAVERYETGRRAAAWSALRRISLDYALMERAERVVAVPLRAGWDDVGSWASIRRAGRKRNGPPVVLVNSPGSQVVAGTRALAVVGVPDVVVVDSDQAVLVVARDRAEEVRKVVLALRRLGREDLL